MTSRPTSPTSPTSNVIQVEFPPEELPDRRRKPETMERGGAVSTTSTSAGSKVGGNTKLAKFVRERGYRAKEVSDGTGIYTRILTELLSGRQFPSSDHVVKLCEFLKCNPWDILG